jgi:hypothetical protein
MDDVDDGQHFPHKLDLVVVLSAFSAFVQIVQVATKLNLNPFLQPAARSYSTTDKPSSPFANAQAKPTTPSQPKPFQQPARIKDKFRSDGWWYAWVRSTYSPVTRAWMPSGLKRRATQIQ